ncbi:MAG: MarR family transcriptional regulator [Cyanobacteria bacterium PR.3.49]|jgi:DNA-binding MarR family transcriptional regulator/N-acetylglutamate synthase-like GNAT family acetyltransferase|nr:MarR family transcriptional regulator [Cyanobacteria bacterium PR.3.49]
MSSTLGGELERCVEEVRSFNRFYTKQIGALTESYLDSRFSLAETRVLYELAHRNEVTAKELCADLNIDAGYLSRILREFEDKGLIKRVASKKDARQQLIVLTAKGRKEFSPLEKGAADGVAELLKPLASGRRAEVTAAMNVIRNALGDKSPKSDSYLLRSPRPGDMGWVVYKHGTLYNQEYGWDERFELLVAGIVADYMKHHNPAKEACWIAEKSGKNVGSVFLVRHTDEIAKLRLLIVDPDTRGMGIGARLVEECIRFAKQAGYRKIQLWTNSCLHSARKIYERAGFSLIEEAPHQMFGEGLVGQTWELIL